MKPSHARHASARLHVHVALLTVVLFIASVATAADSPRKLVFAHTSAFNTSVVLNARYATEPASGLLTDSPNSPCGYPWALNPGTAKLVRDLDTYLCDAPAFTLLEAPTTASIEASSIISFDDDVTRSSFSLPPVGSVANDRPSYVGPLVSDDVEGAWITTFPEGETPMAVTIYDADTLDVVAFEDFPATAGASQYRIQYASGLFFALVEIDCAFGPCPTFPEVYGFASSGDEKGGNFRVFPFGGSEDVALPARTVPVR
jgi:hypothetical protein